MTTPTRPKKYPADRFTLYGKLIELGVPTDDANTIALNVSKGHWKILPSGVVLDGGETVHYSIFGETYDRPKSPPCTMTLPPPKPRPILKARE